METFWLFLICSILFALNFFVTKRYGLKNVEYEIYFEEEKSSEGQEIHIVERIYNGKILPLPWVKSEFEISSSFFMENSKNYVVGDKLRYISIFFLLPYQQIVRRHKFVATKRGFYKLDKIYLVTGDLFGLATADRCYYVSDTLTVYPAFLDLQKHLLPRSSLSGETITKRHYYEDIFHFAGIREYQSHDAFNRINWNATAKYNTLMVNKYEYTSSGDAIILLNVQSSEYERKEVFNKNIIEFGIKIAASLANECLKASTPVGFACNSLDEETGQPLEILLPSQDANQLLKVCEALAHVKIQVNQYFEVLLYDVLRSYNFRELFIITCFVNKEMEECIRLYSSFGIKFTLIMLEHDPHAFDLESENVRVFLAKEIVK
ncbi:DUF58 domain-containing protein [Caldicellulosiruptor sp. DIB 104C]|uniref:DUF58 domain-containing protein n=1 Tax=Caldicellulosiruptor sp. DIB 104C TaxID=3019889 RepID=UPI0023069A67|nr:DUF58 domain-containing protein [Caldicellulosiruptor sp. DIB 104C]